jgi:8-oxo-dGTP diphosphatase
MARKYMANVSVDCVIFGFDKDQLKVLLVERTLRVPNSDEVIFSDLTLTGYHIYEDEDLDSAAARIVRDLTGLGNLRLEQFYTFGELDRLEHPNDQLWLVQFGDVFSKRVVSVGYFSLLPSIDVEINWKDRAVTWYPIDEVKELAFDHRKILDKALLHLRHKLQEEAIGFELLPEKFTLSQMQKLYEAIMGTHYDKRNFRKKVAQMDYVVPLKEKQKGVAHKPARLYKFSREYFRRK